jgi:diguanylate cyclase (GGDEF)-like protein
MAGDPTARVVLAGPFGSPAGGRPVIVVAHRLDRSDGGFAGLVTADIALERIAGLLRVAVTPSHGEASLYSSAFALLARYPATGQPLRPGASAPAELARHAGEGPVAGTFVETSAIDGRERRVAFQRLAAHGLVATVARVRSEQLAHFRHDAVLTLVESVVLAALAIGMAIMIQRSWQRQEHASRELERLARTDALTGLANRRRFFELAESELARAGRYGSPLSVLMIDIDHFKDVNDACGHATGDLVLRQLAETCRAVFRQVDTVGRVGGEEFAVLLPETPLTGAVEVADRLRSAVQATRVPREDGEPIAITVSVGVATSAPGKSVDDLMSQSDTALYEAKRTGRNRVLSWEEPAAA